MSDDNDPACRHSVLEHYLFHGQGGDMLLCLGFGSLYNHHRQPSLDYRIDTPAQVGTSDTQATIWSSLHDSATGGSVWSRALLCSNTRAADRLCACR